MPKLRMLVTAALAAATLALAAPAHAQTVNAACTEDGHSFNGVAFYQLEGARHRWTQWQYILGNTGNHSNVNIRLTENGVLVYSNNSPDNRRQNVLYTHVPTFPVSTLAANTEQTRFEAIFDEFGPDDRCFATTVDV